MADSDAGRSATGPVSTEEAERLSERFRPSWEDDPPTVPREQAERSPTLLGISPNPAPIARTGSNDDLDWELPTNPLPEVSAPGPGPRPAAGTQPDLAPTPAPAFTTPELAQTLRLPAVARPTPVEAELMIHVEVEELPPESKPSGIGEKYVPKEAGAPPVVLKEDIQAAEFGTQAELDAQHRARRAPTIAKLKAIEIPTTLVSPDAPFLPPRRRGRGWLVGLGSVVVLLGGAGALFLARAKSPAGQPSLAREPVTNVVPDTAAPPPPPLPSAETAAHEASAAAAAASAEEAVGRPSAAQGASPHAKATAASAKASSASSKATPAPRPAPASKPAPAAAKTSPKAGGSSPRPAGGKAVIVRDSPF